MGDPVEQQDVEPRVAEDDLGFGPGGRIARHNGGDILLNPLENHDACYIFEKDDPDGVPDCAPDDAKDLRNRIGWRA